MRAELVFSHQHLETFYITFVFMKDSPQPAMLISVGSVGVLEIATSSFKITFLLLFLFCHIFPGLSADNIPLLCFLWLHVAREDL